MKSLGLKIKGGIIMFICVYSDFREYRKAVEKLGRVVETEEGCYIAKYNSDGQIKLANINLCMTKMSERVFAHEMSHFQSDYSVRNVKTLDFKTNEKIAKMIGDATGIFWRWYDKVNK